LFTYVQEGCVVLPILWRQSFARIWEIYSINKKHFKLKVMSLQVMSKSRKKNGLKVKLWAFMYSLVTVVITLSFCGLCQLQVATARALIVNRCCALKGGMNKINVDDVRATCRQVAIQFQRQICQPYNARRLRTTLSSSLVVRRTCLQPSVTVAAQPGCITLCRCRRTSRRHCRRLFSGNAWRLMTSLVPSSNFCSRRAMTSSFRTL